MGRHHHLTRLALGRSPFQDSQSEPQNDDNVRPHLAAEDDSVITDQVQHYNSKGRPVNAATEARNAEMRRAMNSILALAGVVESVERSEHRTADDYQRDRAARRALLAAENDHGDDLEFAFNLYTPLLTWWARNVTGRYQIGLHKCNESFALSLRSIWAQAVGGGIRGIHAIAFAGLASSWMYTLLRMLTGYASDELTDQLSEFIWLRCRNERALKLFDVGLRSLNILLRLGSDMLLLPFLYWAKAQQLGLAPALPLWPPGRSLLPWHPSSILVFGWEPLISIPFLGRLTSPLFLLLLYATLIDLHEASVELSISPLADIDVSNGKEYVVMEEGSAPRDPMGWTLYHVYRVGSPVLRCLGWDIVALKKQSPADYDGDLALRSGSAELQVATKHRSTMLAHLPAQVLATTLDRLLIWSITFPLHTLLLRAVSVAHMASPLPKTVQAVAAAPWLYLPFNGPCSALHRLAGPPADSLHHLATYCSKIGLSFALETALDVMLFGGAYMVARRHGMKKFGWPRSGRP